MSSGSGAQRATPFYCPFCGEQDIVPADDSDETKGRWLCQLCDRLWKVTYEGLASPHGMP